MKKEKKDFQRTIRIVNGHTKMSFFDRSRMRVFDHSKCRFLVHYHLEVVSAACLFSL